MSPNFECPPLESLSQMLLGRLSEESSARIKEHLLGCGKCQQQTRELNHSDTMAEAIRKQAVQFGEQVDHPLLGSVMGRLRDRSLLVQQKSALEGTRISGESFELTFEESLTDFLPALRSAEAADELGRLGDFRLLKLLGHGGMGAVFLADDARLKRRVALKLLRPAFAKKKDAAERFLREAQAAATVQHDNVVAIYRVGENNGMRFVAKDRVGQLTITRLSLLLGGVCEVRKQSDYDVVHFETLIFEDLSVAELFQRSCHDLRAVAI